MTSFSTKRSTPSGGILKEKEYSFLTKRSTPFGPFFDQKEYSFWSIFEAKGVLVWKKKIQLVLLYLEKSGKGSTPFGKKMDQKEYSFIPIFQDKGVDIKWSSIIISGVLGPIWACHTIFCIYRISGIQF